MSDLFRAITISVAAYATAFGPFAALFCFGVFVAASTLAANHETYLNEIRRLPGTHHYAGRESGEQSRDVREVLERSPVSNVAEHDRETSATAFARDNSADNIEFRPSVVAIAREYMTGSPPVAVLTVVAFFLGAIAFPVVRKRLADSGLRSTAIDPRTIVNSVGTVSKSGITGILRFTAILLASVVLLFGVIVIVDEAVFALPGGPATKAVAALAFLYLLSIGGYAVADRFGKMRLT